MNQITPTPANHDRSRPCLPEVGAGREVTGQRRPLLTAVIGRVSTGGRSLWPVGVRCAAAIVFLIFGVSKFVNHSAELASFRHYSLPAPGTVVYAVGVIEICGGLLLAIGLLTRLTALALAADMLGAIVVSGLARWETVSLTLAPMLLAAMIILIRFGAGDWSLDQHLAANMSRRCAAFLLIFSGSMETGDSRAREETELMGKARAIARGELAEIHEADHEGPEGPPRYGARGQVSRSCGLSAGTEQPAMISEQVSADP